MYNMKEITLSEMEQFIGGTFGPAKVNIKRNDEKEGKFTKWQNENIAPAFKAFGSAIKNIGKGAFNWFTGLFSGND